MCVRIRPCQPYPSFIRGADASLPSALGSPRGGWFRADRESQDARVQTKHRLSLPEFSRDKARVFLGVCSSLECCATAQLFIKLLLIVKQPNLYIFNTNFLFKNIRWHLNISFGGSFIDLFQKQPRTY